MKGLPPETTSRACGVLLLLLLALAAGAGGGGAPRPPRPCHHRGTAITKNGAAAEAAALITHTTTGAVVTDGPPPTPAASFEGTAHEHDIAFLIRRVVLDVRMQPAPSGDVSCRTPMTPELSDHGPVGLEGAPAVRQATNLTISSRAPTTRDQSCQPTGWKDRGRAVGDDRVCGGGGVGGEALRRVRRGGGHPLSAFVTPDVYGLSGRRFGDGSAAAVAAFASCVAKGGRRKQGLVPDIGVHFG